MNRTEARLLGKAEQALAGARRDLSADAPALASERAYAAMIQAADALLAHRGQSYRTHGTVNAAFGREFVKTGILDAQYHRWLLDAFRLRRETMHDVDAEVDSGAAWEVFERASEFVDSVRSFLDIAA